MNFKDSDVKNSIQRVAAFVIRNKRNPKTINVAGRTLTLADYLKIPQIQTAKKNVQAFITKEKRCPNYVMVCGFNCTKEVYSKLFSISCTSTTKTTTKTTTTKPSTSTTTTRYVSKPYLLSSSWVKQDYDASCALNSIQQSVYKLTGLKISESTMYKLSYTHPKNGTGHDGINSIIKWINKNYKTNLSVSWKNLSDFGSSSKERWTNIGKMMSRADTAIFMHLGYTNGGASCSSGDNWHGHYEVFDIVNTGTMYIRALNSLSGGYLQDRKISVEECFMKRISQPSICIIKKK